MSKPALPDPLAAATRVKDLARDLASEVTEGYRKSNRYARFRMAFLAGFALLAVVALLVAFHARERDTRATLADTGIGRVLSLDNTSDETWTDVMVTLEGGWKHLERTVRHGQNVGILVTKFERDGVPAPPDLNPRWVEIRCAQVDAKIDLSLR